MRDQNSELNTDLPYTVALHPLKHEATRGAVLEAGKFENLWKVQWLGRKSSRPTVTTEGNRCVQCVHAQVHVGSSSVAVALLGSGAGSEESADRASPGGRLFRTVKLDTWLWASGA